MQRVFVSSQHLVSVGYDPESKTLEIQFHNDSVYQYFNVPDDLYQALLTSEDPGVFFHGWIRQNFNYLKVTA